MPNTDHLALLRQGVGAWNDWRHQSPAVRPDPSQASLPARTSLDGADLSRSNLTRAAHFVYLLLNKPEDRRRGARSCASMVACRSSSTSRDPVPTARRRLPVYRYQSREDLSPALKERIIDPAGKKAEELAR